MQSAQLYVSPAEDDLSAMLIIGLDSRTVALQFQQDLENLYEDGDVLVTAMSNDDGVELNILDAGREASINVQAVIADGIAFLEFIQHGSGGDRFALATGISMGDAAEIIADPIMASGFYMK